MDKNQALCTSQTVALGRSIVDPYEWVIASAEIRPHLDPQVAWVAEASELDPLLRCDALCDAEQLLIACHGSSDCLGLGGGISTAALKTQVSQRRHTYALPINTPVQPMGVLLCGAHQQTTTRTSCCLTRIQTAISFSPPALSKTIGSRVKMATMSCCPTVVPTRCRVVRDKNNSP